MSISLPNGTLLATPAQQTQYTAAVTRILHLSNFPAELKTRDLQVMFKDHENDKGGFRIKWLDDTNALVVFADAGVAKRAYLSHLLSPPPTFPPPAQCKPYTGSDAAHIIQSLAARAMGHRSSMSNFGQIASGQVPLGAQPGNGAYAPVMPGGVDGLPNAMANMGAMAGAGGGHARSASFNKTGMGSSGGTGGAGWTFPSAASRSGSTGASGSTQLAAGGMGPGSGTGSASIGGLPVNRHGRTGSASFSRSAMGGVGGGALSFGGGSTSGSGSGSGPASGGNGPGPSVRTGLGTLPTHSESLDSPAIPAGFSTGGASGRRLTGRHGGGAGSIFGTNTNIGGGGGGGGGGGLGFGGAAAGRNIERPDSRTSASGRSVASSDGEPVVIMDDPASASTGNGSGSAGASTIEGRGKVPFGQWKMPSAGSSKSVSPNPHGTGNGDGNWGDAGLAGRRDSVSADKALAQVQEALKGIKTQG